MDISHIYPIYMTYMYPGIYPIYIYILYTISSEFGPYPALSFQDRRGCVRADAARSHLRFRGEQLGALAVRGWTNRAGLGAIKTWGKPMENHGKPWKIPWRSDISGDSAIFEWDFMGRIMGQWDTTDTTIKNQSQMDENG